MLPKGGEREGQAESERKEGRDREELERGGEEKAEDEVVMVMVRVCSGPRRMRMEGQNRKKGNEEGRKRIAVLLVIPDDCFHSWRTMGSRR